MSFFEELRRELAARGVERSRIRRIVLELEDHVACDPAAKLGEPAAIADRFASELRVARTRTATLGGFASLSLTAVLVAASTLAVSAAGGWPDLFGARGLIVALTGLAAVFAGQVSFVAGVLGAALWLRRPDELGLVQRRMTVALAAASVVVVADGVDAVALRPLMAGWWFAFACSATVASAAGLAGAAQMLRRATALTPAPFQRAAAGWETSWVIAVWVAAVAAMALGSAAAERSWIEGAFRGGFELVAFGAGFLAFGRLLGLRRSPARFVTELHQ
jgi:hypothetical protein